MLPGLATRNRAIAEYRDLLTADDSLTADFLGRLKRGMSAKGLSYGDRELGIALCPTARRPRAAQITRAAFEASTVWKWP